MQYEIIPAILVQSQEAFDMQTREISDVVSMIQLDIADGVFVDGTSWSDPDVVLEKLEIDCELHLMVSNPVEIAREWEQVPQVKRILVHYESVPEDIENIISQLQSYDWEVGVVLNLETPIDVVEPFVEELDAVQFMSIVPGKQGQPFHDEVLDKIRSFREKYPHMPISVDGHVDEDTLPKLLEAGANRFGIGSAIFHGEDVAANNVEKFKQLINKLTKH